MNNTYLLVTEKAWHDRLFDELQASISGNWIRIKNRTDFNANNLAALNPNWIFIPHWSYIIPKEIFNNFQCVIFHMTDLPYGRGGSPLQNLILAGHTQTKISAIKVTKDIDSGDVYLKEALSLEGAAKEIFDRASLVIGKMIKQILENKVQPIPQSGSPEAFTRRHPSESNMKDLTSLEKIYDYIRMLDCEGYPNAFLETEHLRLEFTDAVSHDQFVEAHVRIIKK